VPKALAGVAIWVIKFAGVRQSAASPLGLVNQVLDLRVPTALREHRHARSWIRRWGV